MDSTIQRTFALIALLLLVSWGAAFSTADELKEDTNPEAQLEDEGWEVLFDGSSTDALRTWKRDTFQDKGWVIEKDGSLHAQDGSHDIITRKKYTDFDLRWEWKLSEGANSGIMYRVSEEGTHPHTTGPEYQLIDDPRIHLSSTGSLYGLIKPNDKAKAHPAGEWNTSRIVFKDNNVQHYLNDALVVEFTWGSDDIKDRIQRSKFKKWKGFMEQEAGHIAFQSHGKDLWFRNIKIKDLSQANSSDE